jgi:hypothetical protein
MEIRRRNIIEKQLLAQGYSIEQATVAASAGPEAVAALRVAPPRDSFMAFAQELGFSVLQIATALDKCKGEKEKAIDLLFAGNDADAQLPTEILEPASAIPITPTRICSVCSASVASCSGLACLGAHQHFFCERCLGDHIKHKDSTLSLHCPCDGCCGAPWSYAMLAKVLEAPAFDAFLESHLQQREAESTAREHELRVQLEQEMQRVEAQDAARAQAEAEQFQAQALAKMAFQFQEQERVQAEIAIRDLSENETLLKAQLHEAQSHHASASPPYWLKPNSMARRWNVVPVAGGELAALQMIVRLPSEHALGGRDQRLAGGHSHFILGGAWRIENPELFAKYAAEKARLKSVSRALCFAGIPQKRVSLRGSFKQATQCLPGQLDTEINEEYLLHGTKPETVHSILAGGMNERFSGGLFGHGTYFSEDIAKNDQYVTVDRQLGDHPDLHRELYGYMSSWESLTSTLGFSQQQAQGAEVPHPGNVHYVFVSRVALGHFCQTQDGETLMGVMDEPQRLSWFSRTAPSRTAPSIWSSHKRELATIPASSPPEQFHGLVAELGGRINRHREFISFHGDRTYPEYLIAYQRA